MTLPKRKTARLRASLLEAARLIFGTLLIASAVLLLPFLFAIR